MADPAELIRILQGMTAPVTEHTVGPTPGLTLNLNAAEDASAAQGGLPTRPDLVPSQELSGAQRALAGLFSGLSTFASGINPNVQAQDYIGKLQGEFEAEAERQNKDADVLFRDELNRFLLQREDLQRDEDVARRAFERDQGMQAERGREERAATRRASEIEDRQSFEKEMFGSQAALEKEILGLKQEISEGGIDEKVVATTNGMINALTSGGVDPQTGQPVPSLQDKMRAAAESGVSMQDLFAQELEAFEDELMEVDPSGKSTKLAILEFRKRWGREMKKVIGDLPTGPAFSGAERTDRRQSEAASELDAVLDPVRARRTPEIQRIIDEGGFPGSRFR